MNMIDGYRITKTGAETFTLRQPGTRNCKTVDHQQLRKIVKKIWGLR